MWLNWLFEIHVRKLIPIKFLLAELRRNVTEENLEKGRKHGRRRLDFFAACHQDMVFLPGGFFVFT